MFHFTLLYSARQGLVDLLVLNFKSSNILDFRQRQIKLLRVSQNKQSWSLTSNYRAAETLRQVFKKEPFSQSEHTASGVGTIYGS